MYIRIEIWPTVINVKSFPLASTFYANVHAHKNYKNNIDYVCDKDILRALLQWQIELGAPYKMYCGSSFQAQSIGFFLEKGH